MKPTPMRVTEEITRLKEAVTALQGATKRESDDLSALWDMVADLQETVEQLQSVLECIPSAAPVFLRWKESVEDDCTVARANFGKYSLDVVNGKNAVSWQITEGRKVLEIGCHPGRYDAGLDECEEALRRIVQSRSTQA